MTISDDIDAPTEATVADQPVIHRSGPDVTSVSGPTRTETIRTGSAPPTLPGTEADTVAQALTKAIESLVGLQTAPKPYAPRMEVPSFYGESAKALKWLRQYDAALETNRWDETSKLTGLRKAFREKAATWLEVTYNNKLPATYAEFQADFKRMWLSDELVRAAKERFFRLTQAEDESPLDYLMRLKWHRMEIADWVSEADLLGRVQSGLSDKYQCQGLGLERTLERFEEKVRALAARESVREESAPHVARGPKRETDRPKPADRREPERRPAAGSKPRRDEPRRDRP